MADKRKPPIRQRPIQVKFFVDEKELDLIKQKMAQMGTENMSAYLRKMAIDGYVVNLDMPELRAADFQNETNIQQRKPDCQTT